MMPYYKGYQHPPFFLTHESTPLKVSDLQPNLYPVGYDIEVQSEAEALRIAQLFNISIEEARRCR